MFLNLQTLLLVAQVHLQNIAEPLHVLSYCLERHIYLILFLPESSNAATLRS